MALSVGVRSCFNLSRFVLPASFQQVRWSQYRPEFIEPIYKKEKLDQMFEDGTIQEKAFVPVKAARVDQHNSLFYDELTLKFTNVVMIEGKRELARSLIERTFENIKRIQLEKYYQASDEDKHKIECNPFKILHKAIENCTPVVHLVSVRRGGATYRVPTAIGDTLARFRAMNWLLDATQDKKRVKIGLPDKLSWELIDAANNEGKAVKKKEDLHQQCEANKAYAHYRWG